MPGQIVNAKPKYLLVRGFNFPPAFNAKHIEEALDYEANDDDVFIVTYPKCGTTWMQQICYLIFTGGAPPASIEELGKRAVFFEYGGLEAVKGLVKPGTIKYHLPQRLTPHNANAKYVVVVRNPKDAAVSFYYHCLHRPSYELKGDYHDFFKAWMAGEVISGDYFDFTLGWWHHRHDDNVLLLVYEDMKKDVKKAILDVAEFLGPKYAEMLSNEDVLEKVEKYSSFDFMKDMHAKENPASSAHLRKGVVGDWKQHFSKEESDLVDDKIKKHFDGTGLEGLWRKELKW